MIVYDVQIDIKSSSTICVDERPVFVPETEHAGTALDAPRWLPEKGARRASQDAAIVCRPWLKSHINVTNANLNGTNRSLYLYVHVCIYTYRLAWVLNH